MPIVSTLQFYRRSKVLELTRARVTLRDLSLSQAVQNLNLQVLQKDSATFRKNAYSSSLATGIVSTERSLLEAYKGRLAGEGEFKRLRFANSLFRGVGGIISSITSFGGSGQQQTESGFSDFLRGAFYGIPKTDDEIGKLQLELSIETRSFEWQLQEGIAAQDILVGQEQIQIAQTGIAIAQQERTITVLEHNHAAAILDFLRNRNFNERNVPLDSQCPGRCLSLLLARSNGYCSASRTATYFERLQPVKITQSGYWNVPVDNSAQADNIDRLGLTGSARLL